MANFCGIVFELFVKALYEVVVVPVPGVIKDVAEVEATEEINCGFAPASSGFCAKKKRTERSKVPIPPIMIFFIEERKLINTAPIALALFTSKSE